MSEPQPPTDPWGNPLPPPRPPASGGAVPPPPPPPPPPGGSSNFPYGGDPRGVPGANPLPQPDWWGDNPTATGNGVSPVAPTPSGTPRIAIWALISAIAGFLACGLALGPLAVVLGVKARQRIRTEGTSGDGLALAAIVVGVAAFALNVVVIAVLLANPDLLETTG